MKSFLKFLPIAAAVLLATSCSKDDNDNAPANGRDGVHTVSTSTIPFTIRVNTGRSLKKVGYAKDPDNEGYYNISFTDDDVATLKMIIKENGTQIGEATLQSDKSTFSGGLTKQPSSNTADLTAEISVIPKDAKTFSDVSLAALLATCAHTFLGTFNYGDKTVDLTDQNAYLAISMSPCCDHEITINSDGYTVKDGRIWIAISADADVTSTGLGSEISKKAEEVSPGTIYTVARQYITVADGKKVYFSKGNLQYNPSDPTPWRFAEHQYEICHASDYNVGENYGNWKNGETYKWTDLFGWGMWLDKKTLTDNRYADNINPHKTSGESENDYLSYDDNGSKVFYNEDLNSLGRSAMGSEWITLSTDDWKALFPSPIPHTPRYGHGKVNDVHGVIIIPDDWSDPKPNSKEFTTGYQDWDNNNQYDDKEWELMESAGAVFLPAAFVRNGKEVKNPNGMSAYWSSSLKDGNEVYSTFFSTGFVGPDLSLGRYWGLSVRLVRAL